MARRIFYIISAAALSVGSLSATAGEQPRADSAAAIRNEIPALITQYDVAQKDYIAALKKSKAREDRKKIKQTKKPKPVPNAERFLRWAAANPKDKLTADLLIVIAGHGGKTAEAKRAAKLLAKNHRDLDSARFLKLIMLSDWTPFQLDTFTKTFADHATERATQGNACLLRAQIQLGLVRLHQFLKTPAFTKEYEKREGKEAVEQLQKVDVAEANAIAERLLERVITRFADVKVQGKSLGDLAKPMYYAVSKTAIGKAAPEITGKDLDGKTMKLSDFRGKVIVLTFWGTWCKPCMDMVPYEKKLVARLKDRPFVLLGVNFDRDRKKLDAVRKEKGMTWRSWVDDVESEKAISKRWDIRAWPTIIVIDHKGVIRHKHLRGKHLDAVVDQLLKTIPRS